MLNLYSLGFFRRIALQRTSGSTRGGEISPSVWHPKSAAGSLLLAREGLIPVPMWWLWHGSTRGMSTSIIC